MFFVYRVSPTGSNCVILQTYNLDRTMMGWTTSSKYRGQSVEIPYITNITSSQPWTTQFTSGKKYVVNCFFRQTRYRGVITLSIPNNCFIGLREALQSMKNRQGIAVTLPLMHWYVNIYVGITLARHYLAVFEGWRPTWAPVKWD